MTLVTASPAAIVRHSPCVGICRLDEQTGWCDGCGRTGAEIAGWPDATDADRLAIFERLPERLATIGMATRVLPWLPVEIGSWLHQLQAAGAAISLFRPSRARLLALTPMPVTIDLTADSLVVTTSHQTLVVRRHDKLRAFAAVSGGHTYALGLPKGRAVRPLTTVLTPLEDVGPNRMFDVGLGLASFRLLLACSAETAAALAKSAGKPWTTAFRDDIPADATVQVVAETVVAELASKTRVGDLPGLIAEVGDDRHRFAVPDALVPAWAAPILYVDAG